MPRLTISGGNTVSNVLDLANRVKSGYVMVIMAPAALSGVVSVEVAPVSAGTFVTLQSGGTDVQLTSDKGTHLVSMSAPFLRLSTTAAPGADEIYEVFISPLGG